MKLSRTAIKELTARYRAVLLKCALLNMAAFAIAVSPAKAADVTNWSDLKEGIEVAGSVTRIEANISRATEAANETLGNAVNGTILKADIGNTISTSGSTYDPATGITVGASRTLTLEGLTFTGFKDYDVNNLGTLNLTDVNLGTGVSGTGSTTVTGESAVASMTQKYVTVNGRLQIAADKLTVSNSAGSVDVGSNGILAFTGSNGDDPALSTAGHISKIANAGSITTTGNVTMANDLTGNGTVTVNSGSKLTFVGANNSNAISGAGALYIGDGTNAAALTTTGALNVATTIKQNAQLTAAANLIQGATTNNGTLTLTAGDNIGTTNVLASKVTNTTTGTLTLTDVTATADITNVSGDGPNMIMAGDVTLANLLGEGKALLNAATVDTTLTITGRRNQNNIYATEDDGHVAKIVVSNNGETNNLNALETTGAFLADTTINAGAALVADADKLGGVDDHLGTPATVSIDVTNNGTLALEGGADLEHAKTANADIENKKDVLITDGHVILAGNLEGAGKVTLVADSDKGTSLTLTGTKNENRIDAEISEGREAALHIVNTGDSTHATANNPNALTNTGDLNVDVTIANGARLITAAGLIGKDLTEGKEIIVTNNGNLVFSGLTVDANTLSRNVLGAGTTTLRKSAAVAEGYELANILEVGAQTLSGAGTATAYGNSSVGVGGTISVANLTVNNTNTFNQAFSLEMESPAEKFTNAGTVSSAKLTIGADGVNYTVFDNMADTAKITSADVTVNEMGVLITKGTNVESETIKNAGNLLLTGATLNAVQDDVADEVLKGTTINKSGNTTIASLEQNNLKVEDGTLTVTGNATVSNVKVEAGTLTLAGTTAVSTSIDVDAGATLNLTGTTGEADAMAIAAAAIENDGTINTADKIRFNGDVGHDAAAGTINNSGELTLAGTTNTNTIQGTGSLVVDSANLTTTGSLLQAVKINAEKQLTADADMLGAAGEGNTITVTNEGTLAFSEAGDAYANIANSADITIAASKAVTLNGNLTGITTTGENPVTTDGKVTLANEASLTLKGTLNTNKIQNANEAAGTLIIANNGRTVEDEALLNEGQLLVNTTINAASKMTTAAGLLGDDVTNNGALVLTAGDDIEHGSNVLASAVSNTTDGTLYLTDVTATANITNATGGVTPNMFMTGDVTLANLLGAGKARLNASEEDATLTFTGTTNENEISALVNVTEGKETTADIIVANLGATEGHELEALTSTGALNVATMVLEDAALIAKRNVASIENYGKLELDAETYGAITVADDIENNNAMTVKGNVTVNGDLTGKIDEDTAAVATLANGAGLTLKGYENTNTIRNAEEAPANSTLTITNTGYRNGEPEGPIFDDDSFHNEGKLLVNTMITGVDEDNKSVMITRADLLGNRAAGLDEELYTDDDVITKITVTNEGILALAGFDIDNPTAPNPGNPLEANANIVNSSQMTVGGNVRLNGTLTGAGTTTIDTTSRDSTLTLAGTSNANRIDTAGDEQYAASLIIDNDGATEIEHKLTNTGKLLVATTVNRGAKLVTNAEYLGDYDNKGTPDDTLDDVVTKITLTNNGTLELGTGEAYADIVNNTNTLTVSGINVTLNGNLTGEIDEDTAAETTLNDGVTLKLKGTLNTNTISGTGSLVIENDAQAAEPVVGALTNTGKLLVATSILGGSQMNTAADLLGNLDDNGTPEDTSDDIVTTIAVTNSGILALTGAEGEAEAMDAYANITNHNMAMINGKIKLNGNLTSVGEAVLADGAELTLAGAVNANTIRNAENAVGKLIVKNAGYNAAVPEIDVGNALTMETGKILVETEVAEGSYFIATADTLGNLDNNGTPEDTSDDIVTTITVTNNGALNLVNTTGEAKTAYADIVNNGLALFETTGDGDVIINGNVTNNSNLMAVSGDVTIMGALTGAKKVTLNENATLTLSGTSNNNTIEGADNTDLVVTNLGATADHEAEALVNEGKLLVATTISANSAMTTAAGLLGAEGDGNAITVENSGTLNLTAGTAYAAITNNAGTTMNVAGAVRLEGDLAETGTTMLAEGATLTLAGANNANVINGAGTLVIDNDLTTTGALNSATTVNAEKTLTAGAGLIGADVTNNGAIVLGAGDLTHNIIFGENGALTIDGNVNSSVALAKATINEGKTLTIAAENIGTGEFNNNGTISTSGTLTRALGGNVVLSGNLTFGEGASFANADLDLGTYALDIGTKTLAAKTIANGTLSLTLLENATADTLITTTGAVDDVTLSVNIQNVSHVDVQKYLLTNTEEGYHISLTGQGTYTYAVSANPFTLEEAATIAEFNPDAWTGGTLYILRLGSTPSEISVEKLAEKGVEMSGNEMAAVQTLSDDVKGNLSAGQQAQVDQVNAMLIAALDANDLGQAKQLLKEVGAEKAPAVAQSEAANVAAIMNVVGTRLGGAAPAPAPTPAAGSKQGRSGGDEFDIGKVAVWGQLMYNTAKLDRRDGFDSDSTGFALGAEYEIDDEYKVGIGYAYTSTDLKSDRSKTDVDTHTAFLYGEYKPAAIENFYVNGVLSFGTSSYDDKTKLAGITADYDATTLAAQAMAGYTFGDWTPEGGLRYTNVKQDAYTNSLGIRVGSKTNETWTAVAGAKYAKAFQMDSGMIITPDAKLAVTYDLLRDKQSRSITLANGTGYLAEGENMNRFGIEMGAGVSMKVNNNIDVGVSYEGKFKKDYSDHTGLLNVKYNF